MRRNIILITVLVLPFLASLCWIALKPASPAKSDLSVEFMGMTNNPEHTMTPVRVEVIPGTPGRHALFRVKNNNPDKLIRFDTSCVETNDGQGWKKFVPAGDWAGVGGSEWFPGYSCFYAIAWPPGLPTNVVWRMQMSVAREPTGLRQKINEFTVRKIFGDYDYQTTASSEVKQ